MSNKKNKQKNKEIQKQKAGDFEESKLHPDTKKAFGRWFFGIAAVLVLASFKNAGPLGNFLFRIFEGLFGWGVLSFAFDFFDYSRRIFDFGAPEDS